MSEFADIAIFWGPVPLAAALAAVIARQFSDGSLLKVVLAAVGAALMALFLSFFLTFTVAWSSDAPGPLYAAALAAGVLPSLMIFVPVMLNRRRANG